jgi:hypothetical protein
MTTKLCILICGKHKTFFKAYGRRAILTKSSQFLEYMKLHLISLEQDLEENPMSLHVVDIEGQIYATKHLLSVALDIMAQSEKEYV